MVSLCPERHSILHSRYRVEDVAGQGFSALVLKCADLRSQGTAAVRRYFPDRLTREMRGRIDAETRLPVHSEYIVKAEETFEDGGFLHSAMPFIDGGTLGRKLAEGSLDEASAVYIALCITKAIQELHRIGVLSTDVKPDNIMLVINGRAVLIDLTFFEQLGRKATLSQGTPPYAAPELVNHLPLLPSTDIYSIGVVLFEMLMPELFQQAAPEWELLSQRRMKPDVSAIRHHFPRAFPIIDRAVSPNPRDRYDSAECLWGDLSAYYQSLQGKPQTLVLITADGRSFTVPTGCSRLGRTHFPSPYVSENHCEFNPATQSIKDTESLNGTYVNGTRLIPHQWVKLNDHDVLYLADVCLSVRVS